MSRRVLFGFIFLNILVTGAVLLLAWLFWLKPRSEERGPVMGPTQIVILTATPAPGFDIKPSDYQATIDALQNALDARAAGPPAAGVTPTESETADERTVIATIDPALLPPVPTDLPPGADPLVANTTEDDGCIRHVVEAGGSSAGSIVATTVPSSASPDSVGVTPAAGGAAARASTAVCSASIVA